MNKSSLWGRADVVLALLLNVVTFIAFMALALILLRSGMEPLLALIVTACSRTVNETIAHRAELGRLLLLLPLGFGLASAAAEALRLMLATRRWIAALAPLQCPPNRRLRRLMQRCDLTDTVVLVRTDHPLVFTHGVINPRVWLSTGLMRALNDDELEAVLRHEAYHVKVHDPLRILLVRCLSRMLFFAPAARDLCETYALAKEIAADSYAARAMGGTLPLARALRKLIVARPVPALNAALVGDVSITETRLLALLDPARPLPALPMKHLSISLLWSLIFIAVIAMPAAGHMPSFAECPVSSAFGSMFV
ncbi:MAG: M56 family metallopeptidase [Chloroflexota bacterium]